MEGWETAQENRKRSEVGRMGRGYGLVKVMWMGDKHFRDSENRVCPARWDRGPRRCQEIMGSWWENLE